MLPKRACRLTALEMFAADVTRSDHGDAQQIEESVLISRSVSTLRVKGTSPTTENWLRKLCTYSMNINTSDEDNKHDTNYINKHKYTNTDTRKLHL